MTELPYVLAILCGAVAGFTIGYRATRAGRHHTAHDLGNVVVASTAGCTLVGVFALGEPVLQAAAMAALLVAVVTLSPALGGAVAELRAGATPTRLRAGR